MDYTKFLARTEEVVLAYLGGAYLFGDGRRIRAPEPRPSPGFHRFELRGRKATWLGASDPPAFTGLRRAHGHFVGGWLVHPSGVDRLALVWPDEPAVFALVRARFWHSGDLVFESLDFDGEAEGACRLLLERRAPLTDLSGVPSTLRVAYGLALTLAAAARRGIRVSVREVAPSAPLVAKEGFARAEELIGRLATERERAAEQARLSALHARIHGGAPVVAARAVPRAADPVSRAEAALDAADARMLSVRRLEHSLEVTFEFCGERFVTVTDPVSLQVLDAGICLDGADRLVTLDSLPGVIREAIDTNRLVITRR